MKRTRFRTLWISDTHLGSRGCQAIKLASFLRRVECDTLYLVGDIVDFWRLRNRAYWPKTHNEVLRRLLKMVKRGTRIILVPGNHDEALRHYTGADFGGIAVRLNDIHECADGRRLLVTHGDQCDLVVQHSRLLAMAGSHAYEWAIVLNRHYNRWRAYRGRPYWSLSQYLKLKVKSACTYVSRYQETLVREAADQGLDGVVCGHIHKPEIALGATHYFNCGDWIESCTALVEDHEGVITLIHAHELIDPRHDDSHDPDDINFAGDDEPVDLESLLELRRRKYEVDWQLMPA